jgi:aminopeptidase N
MSIKNLSISLFSFFSLVIISYSQNNSQNSISQISTPKSNIVSGSYICSEKSEHLQPFYLRRGDSPPLVGLSTNTPRHSFDVLDYKIYLDLYDCFFSPYPKSYTGNVIVKFLVDSSLNSINLNAFSYSMQITSVSLSGVSFTHSNNIVNIQLDRTYNPGEVTYVQVFFNHLNVSDGAFYATGGIIYTDCEPERARNWIPCWDKPSDKATLDMTVKVPASVRLGSNGRLNDSTLTGDTLFYHWISRDPLATYLITIIGEINYNIDFMFWHKNSNPMDSIPIRFYYTSGENTAPVKNVILDMMTYYSQLFGDYPFEKNGFSSVPPALSPWCTGMENQTLINLFCANWDEAFISHEFAHQWFGDVVTCGTWADVWLNESFATYCEALWIEHKSGYSEYKNKIYSDAYRYMHDNPGWAMYNANWKTYTPSMDTLFYYTIEYAKGACVLHMLRYVLGDSVFFNSIKAYATDTSNFKFKNAVTDDFTAKISQVSGRDISWFINEWVKQPNHPVYRNVFSINKAGPGIWNVSFKAAQIQTNSPFHKMPIVIQIHFYSGPDSNIAVMNDQNNQQWAWTFNRHPSDVVFDPNSDIILKEGTTTADPNSESQFPGVFALHQNYPNPFNPVTSIGYDVPVNSHITIKLYNTIGELVTILVNEQKTPGRYSVLFDGNNYASGIYFYEITATGTLSTYTSVRKMALVK